MRYHFVAFIVVAIWGSTFVFTKMLLQSGLTPAQIFTFRFIIAYVLLALYSVGRTVKKEWGRANHIFHLSSFISHLSSFISHLSSFIWACPPAFCVWLTVQNYIKNQCHPENPSTILLSVNCPSFRYFFPSTLRQNRPCLYIAPLKTYSVGFCNPTALNISICNAATILVRILRHLWLYISHGDR